MSKKLVLQCLVLVGAFMINFPVGIPWFFGNLSTYTNSYFIVHIGPQAYDVRPDWLLSTFILSTVFSFLTADLAVKKFGFHFVHFAGLFIFSSAIFTSYFTVQHSVGWMLITFMLFGGYAAGTTNILCLMCASKVMPGRVGVASAVVCSAFGFGAILTNFVVTGYINPDNLTPDLHKGNMVYFSQAKILDRVPSVFIVIGLTVLACHVPGYLMTHLPLLLSDFTEDHSSSDDLKETIVLSKTEHKTYKTQEQKEDSTTSSDDSRSVTEKQHSIKVEGYSNLTPKQIFRTRSFYQLLLSVSVLTYSSLLTQNYYKLLGQLWIKDDSFLTTIGSLSAVSSSICRLLIGLSIDFFGLKNTLVLTLSLNSITLGLWYLAAQINPWFYLFCNQIVSGVGGAIYILFPMAVLKLYGREYYATNYGIVMVASVTTSLVCPPLFAFLLDNFGWFSPVAVGGIYSVLALVSLVVIMPQA